MRANGKPETLDVLLAWSRGDNPYRLWGDDWGKVIHKLTEDLMKRGLVTGGSPSFVILTPRGREHLAKLRDKQVAWFDYPLDPSECCPDSIDFDPLNPDVGVCEVCGYREHVISIKEVRAYLGVGT